jgi:hypothetical protein
MKKSVLLKVLTAIAACVALGSSPQNAFAQRGGHGGGGGFHGGGGMGFHGGSVGGFIQAATMVTAVDIPMAATMEEPITVGADTTATMAATDGMVATMDGMEDIGVIHTSGLALDGRIGVGDGDTPMATTVITILIMLFTLTILTQMIVLRAIHALPMGTKTRRQRTPVRSSGTPQQSLRDLKKRALLTRMTGVARSRQCRMVRSSQLTR